MSVVFVVLMAITTAVGAAAEQPEIVAAALSIGTQYVFGLCGSFALHELGHLAALSRARGVTGIALERTLWRTSVRVHGVHRAQEAAAAAIAGPGTCVLAGGILWVLAPGLSPHGWYLAHAVFVVPVFNDGRQMVALLRSRRHQCRIPRNNVAPAGIHQQSRESAISVIRTYRRGGHSPSQMSRRSCPLRACERRCSQTPSRLASLGRPSPGRR